jgi:ABC-type sugar transport system permease subunit
MLFFASALGVIILAAVTACLFINIKIEEHKKEFGK